MCWEHYYLLKSPTLDVVCECMSVLQVDSTGTAGYDDLGTVGKVGQVSMRPAPKHKAVRELQVGSEDLRQAAEVILGRLDIADLIGGSAVQQKAAVVRFATESAALHTACMHLSANACSSQSAVNVVISCATLSIANQT